MFYAAAVVDLVSLNSAILPGSDVNIPQTRLRFQFRMGAVDVCGDICVILEIIAKECDDLRVPLIPSISTVREECECGDPDRDAQSS